MKTPLFVTTLLLVSAFLLIAAISRDQQRQKKPKPLSYYTDNSTGCQYISSGSTGLSPRYSSSGSQICNHIPEK